MKNSIEIPELRKILRMIKNNLAIPDIAKAMCISRSVAYEWASKLAEINYDESQIWKCIKKRGPKFKNFAERNSKISEIVAEDNSLTQKGIQTILREQNISISQSTISKSLKALEITRKRLILISEKKNDQDTINKRQQYSIKYRRYNNDDLIFIDETGFNLHTKRAYGYSPKNLPARIQVKSSKGQNVSLLAMISVDKVINYTIVKGACNIEILLDFFKDTIERNLISQNNVIIMDNVSFHRSEEIKRYLNSKSLNFDYLPV